MQAIADISNQFQTFGGLMTVMILTLTRMGTFVAVSPFLGQMVPSGLVRTGVVFAFSMPVLPVVYEQYMMAKDELDTGVIILLILKEALLGMLIAITLGLMVFGLMAAGFFLDFQRGAGMAEVLAPSAGEQTSVTSVFLVQMYITVLFSTGGFLIVLRLLYSSFDIWGVFQSLPVLNNKVVDWGLGMLDHVVGVLLVLFAPIVIVMLLVEIMMAIYSRFNAQLNVTIMAMPIKTGLMFFILLVMMPFVLKYYINSFSEFPTLFQHLIGVFGE